jgi:RNA-directed DNA polymerase
MDDGSPPIPNSNCGPVQFAVTVPTVLDRFVQQAVMQVLQGRWDGTFSEHSHGFRPGRSAHQAVRKAQQYVAGGRRWVVDLDLEKFLDRTSYCPLIHEVVANR